MLKNSGDVNISNKSVLKWMINEEPNLVQKVVKYYLHEDMEVSFDSNENERRLLLVSESIEGKIEAIYNNLNGFEKTLIYIMSNSFGWIVYQNIDETINIIAHVFRINTRALRDAVDSLLRKFIIFRYERLKRYNLLFSPPAILKQLSVFLTKEKFLSETFGFTANDIQENLSIYQYISLVSGFISYVITYSPRSSESNEIHKIDLSKMVDFFSDFVSPKEVIKIIKKLSRFGFFEKHNNRILINKSFLDKMVELSINEQLFVIFLYDFMDKFDFKKSYFMTLKILAHQKDCISLRELFYYYLNNETYLFLKSEGKKKLRVLLQHEELKFTFFIKSLEEENIATIQRKNKKAISIATDYIILNEPHISLLNNSDLSRKFRSTKFIVEQNYEIIVEPYVKPDILFKLTLFTEPVTMQTISIFKITQESIYRSFAYGIQKEDIIRFLKKHSKHKLPNNVIAGIESFINNLEINKLDKYKIIQLNSTNSHKIKENFRNKVIELEPHIFLVFDEKILNSIKEFCDENKLNLRYIEDFLHDESYYYKAHENDLRQHLRHLHTIKEFFDFYGSSVDGTGVKIDNKI